MTATDAVPVVEAFAGLEGDIGRAKNDLAGDNGAFNGERAKVRELCDFGDKTVGGTSFRDRARPVRACAGTVVDVFARFFCTSMSAPSFSLSSEL